MINSHEEGKAVNERLRCMVCRQPYRVNFTIVHGQVAGSGIFHPPRNVCERLARQLSDEPLRQKELAQRFSATAIVILFTVSLILFVVALVIWSRHSSSLHTWLVVLLAIIYCLPYIRFLPSNFLTRRKQRSTSEARSPNAHPLPTDGNGVFHIRLDPRPAAVFAPEPCHRV